jgi:hypothetical protein
MIVKKDSFIIALIKLILQKDENLEKENVKTILNKTLQKIIK